MKKQAWLYLETDYMKELVKKGIVKTSKYYKHLGLSPFIILTQSSIGRPILLFNEVLFYAGRGKIKVYNEGNWETSLIGLSRAPINVSSGFYTWEDFKRCSGWKQEWFEDTEKVAKAIGDNVKNWYFTFEPLHFCYDLCGPIQKWNGQAWEDWEVQPI